MPPEPAHIADSVCVCCGHPIRWDHFFGWLHKDFGPDGRSFDHYATAPNDGAERG